MYNIWKFLNKHINFLIGSLSGVLTGSIVFFINYEHGFYPAFNSFLKQFFFNLIMGGFNARTCEKLINNIQNKFWGYLAATFIPTTQAFLVIFALHYFGGTPKPMASTFWQIGANIIIFFFMAMFFKNRADNKLKIIKIIKVFLRK